MLLTIEVPNMLSETNYVRRCLECEFIHQKEERDYQGDPAFSSILANLDSKKYLEVIKAVKQLLPQFRDFDLLYLWIFRAYQGAKQSSEAKAILNEGLLRSKRKIFLLTDMGEIESELGNIEAAVYWWSQALAGLSLNPIDCDAYLFLAAVAEGVGYKRIARRLLNRADILFRSSGCCHKRLYLEKEKAIDNLVSKSSIETIKKVFDGIDRIYYF